MAKAVAWRSVARVPESVEQLFQGQLAIAPLIEWINPEAPFRQFADDVDGATRSRWPPAVVTQAAASDQGETEGFGQGLRLMNIPPPISRQPADYAWYVVGVVMLGKVPQAHRVSVPGLIATASVRQTAALVH